MSEDLTPTDNIAISKELETIARMVSKRLMRATGGKPVPFSLYTWGGNRSQYVSNIDRDQVKAAMQETLERWNEDDGPLHKTAN
ncbi:hypothetical protein [Roseibium album]|uniref:hypothetical protein n=1 Tax=Roseibium album TaxID=311410 RepID=UPI00391D062F